MCYSSIFDTLRCYNDAYDVRIVCVHDDTTMCYDDDGSATAVYLTVPVCDTYMMHYVRRIVCMLQCVGYDTWCIM